MKKFMLGLLFLAIFGVGFFFGNNNSKSSLDVDAGILGTSSVKHQELDEGMNVEENSNNFKNNDEIDNDEKKQSFEEDMKSKKNEYLEVLNRLEMDLENSLNTKYDSGITSEMIDAFSTECEKWDTMLNDIYTYLSENLNREDFRVLKSEQIDWIKFRDKKSKEAGSEFEGGSFAAINELSSLKDTTKERCYELVNLYFE